MTLKDWLIENEGLRYHPYTDTVGKLTIGVGRNLSDRGLTLEEIHFLLDNDIARCKKDLSSLDWYKTQPPGVQEALLNMCFNLGITRLKKFTKMIDALRVRQYHKAALEALDSTWAQQVGDRAKQVAAMIREGK